MKIVWRILIALFILVGFWIGLLSARPPWITPVSGVRLEPLRAPVSEGDIRPGSAYALLREAVALLPETEPNVMSGALANVRELPPSVPGALHTNTVAVLEYYGPVLDRVRLAAFAPQERIPLPPLDQRHPASSALRISRALAFSAHHRTVDGDLDGALDDLEAGLRIGDIVTRGGDGLGHLLDRNIKTELCALIVRTTECTAYPPERLRRLQSALLDMEANAEPAAEGVRCQWFRERQVWDAAGGSYRRFFEKWFDGVGEAIPDLLKHAPILSVLLMNSFSESRANFEAVVKVTISLTERPYDAAAVHALQESLRIKSVWDWLSHRDPIGHFFYFNCEFSSVDYWIWPAAHPTKLAALRAARTALALHRFRVTAGRLPNDLDELVPDFIEAVPADPFDGQPLRYLPAPDGTFRIYSVGPDGRDDGGKKRPPRSRSRQLRDMPPYDLTY